MIFFSPISAKFFQFLRFPCTSLSRFFFFSFFLTDAAILFDVDLIDIREGIKASEIADCEDITLTFEEKLKKVKRLRDTGNGLKKNEKDVNGAITA